MVRLFFSQSLDEVEQSPYGGIMSDHVWKCRVGTPFLLDAEMYPLQIYNNFLRRYMSGHSPKTVRAYAYDICRFANFLENDDIHLSAVNEHILMNYRAIRERSGISSRTLAREFVPIRALFNYLLTQRIVSKLPWEKVGIVSSGYPPSADEGPREKALNRSEWDRFRNVGLAGREPDGSVDFSVRRDFPLRDVAAGELALTTGMRVQEWSSLLMLDLTWDGNFLPGKSIRLEAVTKRHRPRTVYLASSAYAALRGYMEDERSAWVRRAQPLIARKAEQLCVVEDLDYRRGKVTYNYNSTRFTYLLEKIPVAHRRLLVQESREGWEPLGLFVGRSGLPPSIRAWHQTFARASDRLTKTYGGSSQSRNFRVTTHSLRHTFAHVMFRSLQEENVRIFVENPEIGRGTIEERSALNPIHTLQKLLGHRNFDTTNQYLTSLDDTGEIVQKAFEVWDEDDGDFRAHLKAALKLGGDDE